MCPQITNENIDHAEILKARSELLEAIRNPKEKHLAFGYISKQFSDLEKIRAESQGRMMELLLKTYNVSCQNRYDAGRFLRALGLGLSAKKDADRAAKGAFEEVKTLISAMENMNQMIIANAVVARLPFLRLLTGSHERGNQLAVQLLRAYLNTQNIRNNNQQDETD